MKKQEFTQTGVLFDPLEFECLRFLQHNTHLINDPKYREDPFLNELIELFLKVVKSNLPDK